MKEIKAYIRRDKVNLVIEELEKAGVPGITVVDVHPVGYGYEPNYFESYHTELINRYRYLAIVKLEVVCADKDLERFVQLVQEQCCTGDEGDGMIFVAGVFDAIRIRDGARGEQAL